MVAQTVGLVAEKVTTSWWSLVLFFCGARPPARMGFVDLEMLCEFGKLN